MEVLQPVQGRGHHEAAHLIAAEVVDQRVPVLVVALQGVFVLVQGRAVETRQAMFVGREMRRHPVEQHADTALVAGIDEGGVVFGATEARGGREQRQWLVAPGAAERVLHDWQQFDVGEAQFLHIGHQALGQFTPVEITCHLARVIQFAAPRTWVQLIDRQGRVIGMALRALRHPVVVLPGVAERTRYLGRSARRQLGGAGQRVCLQGQYPVLAQHLELVGFAHPQARHEQFPYPGAVAQAHGVAAAVPVVEIAHHRHPPGVRRPHREAHAVDAISLDRLGAEAPGQVTVVAFGEQVQVHVAQLRAEAVGVFGDLLATGPADLQQVRVCLIEVRGEQPRQAALLHFGEDAPVMPGQDAHIQGVGQEGADHLPARAVAMGAEYRKWIGVLGAGQGVEVPLPKAAVFTRCNVHSDSPQVLISPCRPCKGTASQLGRFSASYVIS
ncbi:hypothetical protein D3C81_1108820 [compost metagenome]